MRQKQNFYPFVAEKQQFKTKSFPLAGSSNYCLFNKKNNTCQLSFAGQCGLLMLKVIDEAQLLAHPQIGNNYLDNEQCSWILTTRDSTSRIRITFLSFATEQYHDFLIVSRSLICIVWLSW